MTQAIDQLRKILELEQAKDYQDLAVIGGLDNFLRRLPQVDVSMVSVNYSALDRHEREQWVKNMIGQLDTPELEDILKSQPLHRSTSMQRYESLQSLNVPITTIKGINSKLASKFGKLGINSVRDILYFFPRRHIDYSQRKLISELEVGPEQTIVATVWEAVEKRAIGRRRATEAIVGDESGNIRVVWFNQPYLVKRLSPNSTVVLSGRVGLFRGRKVFESPEWETLESNDLIHTGRLIPVYPLTAGLSPRVTRKLVKGTVDYWTPKLVDYLPEDVRKDAKLLPLDEAIQQSHYPQDELNKAQARKRLAFDELFLIQLGVLARKRAWQEEGSGIIFDTDSSYLEPFIASLTFRMTAAQERTIAEITSDLSKSRPMSRLLQGEVGSGKTIVAVAAMLLAVANGFQAVLMAPTEILAEQHFYNICNLLSRANGKPESEETALSYHSLLPHPISVGLLTGGLRASSKRDLHKRISEGAVNFVIGTHALIQKGVKFQQLGLCVVDEQHRFGVTQRSELQSKGAYPHVLVMSATPIPRTLALTVYGDLDLSVIDELPPGRMEIKTKWLAPSKRQSAYDFIRKEITARRQAFIICPLVEESEVIQTKAALTEYEQLSRNVFPNLSLDLLHGRMSGAEKEDVMRRFRDGEFDILVSTPVVEVGVDIPNATVMLVEGADRFGLAQLHQFRGRVGRGQHQSYCLLLAESPSEEARERFSLLEQLQDGFALAEEDLRLRGPGEFFGTRQSGLPDLKMVKLSDVELLELARAQAIRLFQTDPRLEQLQHKSLSLEVSRLWGEEGKLSQ
ncbi:ATP-dependent DNA helicase RecG [Chloroflexota bacterium]